MEALASFKSSIFFFVIGLSLAREKEVLGSPISCSIEDPVMARDEGLLRPGCGLLARFGSSGLEMYLEAFCLVPVNWNMKDGIRRLYHNLLCKRLNSPPLLPHHTYTDFHGRTELDVRISKLVIINYLSIIWFKEFTVNFRDEDFLVTSNVLSGKLLL